MNSLPFKPHPCHNNKIVITNLPQRYLSTKYKTLYLVHLIHMGTKAHSIRFKPQVVPHKVISKIYKSPISSNNTCNLKLTLTTQISHNNIRDRLSKQLGNRQLNFIKLLIFILSSTLAHLRSSLDWGKLCGPTVFVATEYSPKEITIYMGPSGSWWL